MVAAAVIGAAAIGAAGSAVAGSESASTTRDATNASIAEQNSALGQQAQLSAPYRALGQSAVPTLQNLLGLTPGSNPQAALAATPGYQFALNQGLDATKNAAAASGMLLSGNTLEGLSRYTTGLADQTYQQQVGNLENVVGLGQAAAAGQAANIGNAASTISGNLINQGNTLAGIDANTIAGITKSVGNAANNYTTLSTLQDLNSPGYSVAGTPSTMSAGDGYTFNTGYP